MNGGPSLLSVRSLSKGYRVAGRMLPILTGVDLEVREGEILAIVGQSGSGKSTLLYQMGLLDRPDDGVVEFRGRSLPLSGPEAAHARNRLFGFVFQFYHLLPEFSAIENVRMPALILEGWGSYRRRRRELHDRSRELLCSVGLKDRMHFRPPQLSGGERQRVAIARALMNRPELLLCDEPTGNLDRRTAEGVKSLLWELNREGRQTMVVVTHDRTLAADADRTLTLLDGRLIPEAVAP